MSRAVVPFPGLPFEMLPGRTGVPSPILWPEMKEGFSITAKDRQQGILERKMPGGGRR